MSVISSEMHNIIASEDIYDGVVKYASGYDKKNIVNLNQSKSKIFTDTVFLNNVNENSLYEEIGTVLFNNTMDVINSMPTVFKEIVENNFKIETYVTECGEKRTELEEQLSECNLIVGKTLLRPNKEIYEMRANQEIYELMNREGTVTRTEVYNVEADKQKIIYNHNETYLQAYEEFEKETAHANEANAKMSKLKKLIDKEVVIEILLTSFLDIQLQIVNKIKQEMNKHALVRALLEGTIKIANTNEVLSNPLNGTPNLCGILEILKANFHKRGFVNFTISLIETLSYNLSEEDTKNNPKKAVQDTEKLYSRWLKRDMWTSMTQDLFFTSVLIKSMHPNVAFRRDVVNEVTRFIDKMKEEGDEGSAGDMRVYRHMCQFINEEQDNRELTKYQSGTYTPKFNKYRKNYLSNFNNAEQAAAANINNDGKKFSGEVTKSQNIKVYDAEQAKTFPYSAYRSKTSLCAKCYPDKSKSADHAVKPCQPLCYQSMCKKCHYYGHKKTNCMQSHDVDGKALE